MTSCPHCAAPLPENLPVLPKRLAELRHHHERQAHFTQAMVGELLAHVDLQAEALRTLKANAVALLGGLNEFGTIDGESAHWLEQAVRLSAVILGETP